LTVKEAAEKFGVTPGRINQWIKAGRIDAKVEDGHWVVLDDATRPEKLRSGRKVEE